MKKEELLLKHTDKIKQFEYLKVKNDENDYGIELGSLKPLTGYIVDDINLNTIKFCKLIDKLAIAFDNVWLIKCGIDDPHTERIIILITDRASDKVIKDSLIPVNQEGLINFLYAVYSRALFVLKANENDYKKIVASCVQLVQNVKMF